MGANIPGKRRTLSPYLGGLGTYRETGDRIAANGYEGFALGRRGKPVNAATVAPTGRVGAADRGVKEMPSEPDVQALLEQFEAQGVPPFDEMGVPQARDAIGAFGEPAGRARAGRGDPGHPRARSSRRAPVRAYHPEPGTALPLLVYVHGGGWVVGNIEVVDKPCRALANASRCVVASTQYRLSPETKFPGPVEDCYAATSRLAEHAGELGADPAKVGAGGNSRPWSR